MNSEKHSLAEDLLNITNTDEKEISIKYILEILKDKGFGLLLIILSLPSALPVPAPGYSTPFGIVMTILGFQMVFGKKTPWMPSWALNRKIKKSNADKFFKAGAKFFKKTEKLIKPRMSFIDSKLGYSFAGFIVIFMAILMIFPIPLTNTIPAMVIFIIGAAISERDGLLLILSVIGGAIALALYLTTFYFVYYLGSVSFDEIKNFIKNLI